MALSTEQVLLLNNLMYMDTSPLQRPDDFAGKSVGEWLSQIDVSQLDSSKDYGSFITGDDWKNIIQAVQNDDTLANMRIADTHVDSDGVSGRSAILTSDATNDAVVVFRGTESSAEWADNFMGGNVPDTRHQENALEWYQSAYKDRGLEGYEITVTGHSKGGNKAKYITLLDDTVDHCVSFDGQGFSDEFMEKYADQIASRQSVIENHNVDYDYVNLLLNDVGETTYYEGHDYGSGGFLENHCPNTFMNFDKDGNFTININPNGQAAEMKALDKFLNNMIRSMPESRQSETLECFGLIAGSVFGDNEMSGEEQMQFILDLIFDSKYSDDVAYVAAYFLEYAQAKPELAEHIKSVMGKFGMEPYIEYVDMVNDILNFDEDYFLIGHVDFDRLYGWVTGAADILPDWALQWILNKIEKESGIKLTLEHLKTLLEFAGMVYGDMQSIKIKDNGGDIAVDPVSSDFDAHSGVPTHGKISVNLRKMRTSAEELQRVANLLGQVGVDLENLADNLTFAQRLSATSELQEKLRQSKNSIDLLMGRARDMGGALNDITEKYESTETLIVSFL